MPHMVGDVVKLRAGRGSTVRVTAPNQSTSTFEAPHGHFSLLLAQPGLWVYEWDGEDAGSVSLEVARRAADADEQVPSRVLSGRFTTGSA